MSRTYGRRTLLGAAVAGIGAGLVGPPAVASAVRGIPEAADPSIVDPALALTELLRGNQRWRDGTLMNWGPPDKRRQQGIKDQTPYAVVFGCIDSRVPPEIVFDQDVNNMFDIRTAAHVIDPVVTGSVEYGPLALGTPLIFVLGHQNCGAAKAAVNSFVTGRFHGDSIRAVELALGEAYSRAARQWTGDDTPSLIELTTKEQVKLTVQTLAAQPGLGARLAAGKLKIVGGYYTLADGKVELLTDV